MSAARNCSGSVSISASSVAGMVPLPRACSAFGFHEDNKNNKIDIFYIRMASNMPPRIAGTTFAPEWASCRDSSGLPESPPPRQSLMRESGHALAKPDRSGDEPLSLYLGRAVVTRASPPGAHADRKVAPPRVHRIGAPTRARQRRHERSVRAHRSRRCGRPARCPPRTAPAAEPEVP